MKMKTSEKKLHPECIVVVRKATTNILGGCSMHSKFYSLFVKEKSSILVRHSGAVGLDPL